MLESLEELKFSALSELESAGDLKALDNWRVKYLGRKGSLTGILRGLAELPIEERKEAGAAANRIKSLLEESLREKQESIKKAEIERRLEKSRIDVTLPGRPIRLGRLHPTTQTLRQTCEIFTSMGFEIVEGGDRLLQFRSAEYSPRPSRAGYVGYPVGRLPER